MNIVLIVLFTTILVNNVVLSQFLGLCPFLGVSKQLKTATGMSLAVIFVITVSSALSSVVYNYVLVSLDATYLSTIVFILIIAALVQFIEMFLKKFSRPLYEALGVYLPLITTNCAVLGVALTNVQNEYGVLMSTLAGFGTACGFAFAIIIMAAIRENLDLKAVPAPFRGMPLTLIISGLMAMAFFGFSGISL